MKKIIILFLVMPLIFLVSGCRSQIDTQMIIEKFTDHAANIEQYTMNGVLHMKHADDTVSFNVTTEFLYPSFYRVTLDNTQNNNRQIIIKNDDGVFVLTPVLNKVFKFDSNWPANSSHTYLLSSLARDIIANETTSAVIEGNDVVITTGVDHKTNVSLTYQKIVICPTTQNLRRVSVYDANDEWQIKFEVNEFNTSPGLRPRNFHVEQTMTDNVSQMGSGRLTREEGTLDVTNVVEGTMSPNYKMTEDKTIKTFSGDRSFTIITRRVEPSVLPIPLRTHDSLEVFNNGIAAFSENGMTFFHFDKEVTIISNELQPYEFINIAASLSWNQDN